MQKVIKVLVIALSLASTSALHADHSNMDTSDTFILKPVNRVATWRNGRTAITSQAVQFRERQGGRTWPLGNLRVAIVGDARTDADCLVLAAQSMSNGLSLTIVIDENRFRFDPAGFSGVDTVEIPSHAVRACALSRR